MAQRNIVVSAYLSPDTEMRCLQSLLNFMPVTISEWPNMVATHSPEKKSKMERFLSEQLVAM